MVVLGLLAESPQSGYDMQRLLQQSRAEQWADILPGSIYHALKRLHADGLATLEATEQTGFRLKATYSITPAGRDELRRLLREAWRTPSSSQPAQLYAALSFIHALPRADVLDALQEQGRALEEALEDWEQGADAKREVLGNLPAYVEAALANGRQHIQLDLALVRQLRIQLSEDS